MTTVLVTGATGFLGSAIARHLLEQGAVVRGLARDPTRLPSGVEAIEGDLQSRADLQRAVRGAELVIHAGARVSTRGSWDEFERTNVNATRDLIELAVEHGVRRIVHVSSLAVYAVTRDGVTVTEETSYESGGGQRGFYARSKLIADRLAMQAAGQGLPLTVVRPGLLYGPGREPPVGRQSIGLGPVRVILGRSDYLMPLSFVDNVADAICRAAREGRPGRAYTLVDQNVPLREYLARYRRASGRDWQAVYLPAPVLSPFARVLGGIGRVAGRSVPLTLHQLQRTTWSARYDCTRAHEELGWRPLVSLEEGLRRTFGAP